MALSGILGFGGCLLLLAGCQAPLGASVDKASSAARPEPTPPAVALTPLALKNQKLGRATWDPAWDALIADALPTELLGPAVPEDVRDFCPRFFALGAGEARAFWAYFFQALAAAESGFRVAARFQEAGIPGTDAVTGRPIWSEGLLQLSYQDSAFHGCDFRWETDRLLPASDPRKSIFDPRANLECGIRILYKQVVQKKLPLFPPRHFYWSTLTRKEGNASFRRFRAQMANVPAFCRE
jgi:hypothetical protein